MAVGARGRVLVQFSGPRPVVRLQVRLGTQAIAEVVGQELRDMAGLYFSVPRTPGTYDLTVWAQDNRGCETTTTTTRTITVQ